MCEKMKFSVQQLMNQGTILVEQVLTDEGVATMEIPYYQTQIRVPANPVTPLVIIVPSPFPFYSIKDVSWNYDSTIYMHGQKQEDKPLVIKESVVNIVGTGRMTRSGQVFASTPPLEKNNFKPLAKGKGKRNANADQGKNPTLNKSPLEDVDELMRIIRRSDYKMVEQLNQMPSKISISYLLFVLKHTGTLS